MADSDLIVNAVQLDQSGLRGSGDSQDSGYTSPYRYGGFLPSLSQTAPSDKSASQIRVEKMVVEEDKNTRIRILLIFSTDGVPHAENIVTGLENFSIQVPVRHTLVGFYVTIYLTGVSDGSGGFLQT